MDLISIVVSVFWAFSESTEFLSIYEPQYWIKWSIEFFQLLASLPWSLNAMNELFSLLMFMSPEIC